MPDILDGRVPDMIVESVCSAECRRSGVLLEAFELIPDIPTKASSGDTIERAHTLELVISTVLAGTLQE